MPENRKGWAYGERIPAGSQWLTILGSAHKTPELHATKEAALAALGKSVLANRPGMTVEHVTELWHGGVTGPRPYAYRITEGDG